MASNQELLAIKEKYRRTLLKQVVSAYDQLGSTLNQADIPKLEEQVQQLEEKFKVLENEIDALKKASADDSPVVQSQIYRGSYNSWEDNLHRIDFSKVNKQLKNICQRMEDQEGGALFLLQNSGAMGGKWGLKTIRHCLQELGTWYPPLEYAFSQHQTVNPNDFLYEVAQKFDYQIGQDILEQQLVTGLIEKIYSALAGGHVFLIQVEIPYLDAKSTFLEWFVNQFWCLLMRRLPMVGQTAPLVKVFAVITVRGAVDQVCLPKGLCSPRQQFDGEKVLNLPLQKWTETDIRNWLVKFSGLMSPAIGMTRPEVDTIAQSIYQVSKGRPIDVYDELMNTMTQKVS